MGGKPKAARQNALNTELIPSKTVHQHRSPLNTTSSIINLRCQDHRQVQHNYHTDGQQSDLADLARIHEVYGRDKSLAGTC